MSDSTTLRLRHADKVERQAIFVTADGFLETLFRGQPRPLAPGQRSVKFDWSHDRRGHGHGARPPYVDVVGVMPHMHERGVRQQMRIGPDGAMACAANVDRWDFNWQKFYFYETPPRLEPEHPPGDHLRVRHLEGQRSRGAGLGHAQRDVLRHPDGGPAAGDVRPAPPAVLAPAPLRFRRRRR